MDDISTLFLLSLSMFVGCYLAGMIPLSISFSEENLKLLTVLGAGLLVGTALAVIIPEGVNAMYSGDLTVHHHVEEMKDSDNKDRLPNMPKGGGEADDHHEVVAERSTMNHDHSIIGISLVAGFIFMLLVDQLGGYMHSKSSTDDSVMTANGTQHHRKITATIGLVVHGAADGVAMGAAINMSEIHITLIIFFAIMLHKAPAAFGLVSFLMHENFERSRIRRHLTMFSAAAPLLTLLTYMALSQNDSMYFSGLHTTGIAMLFSAGTFLYVATVHVLPEIATVRYEHRVTDETVVIRERKTFQYLELLALITGAMVPVFLAMGHRH